MKKIFLTLTFAVLTAISLMAQLTEGHITYKIDITSDNPDMQMAVSMMQGSTMEVYFADKNTRSEMKMGTVMTVTTITSESTGDMLMLMSGMVGQNAIKSKLDEVESKKEEAPKMEVTLVEETKTISGYTCKKAIVTTEDGTETVYWYTSEIEVSKRGQNYLSADIPGFPMQFELNNNGMIMTMTVEKLDKKLGKKSSELFDMKIPAGYKEMTMEELMQMGMGM